MIRKQKEQSDYQVFFETRILFDKIKFHHQVQMTHLLWGVTSLEAWYFREKSDKFNLCTSDLPGRKTFSELPLNKKSSFILDLQQFIIIVRFRLCDLIKS